MGLTQKELREKCGKHFSHICHIERGHADPSLKVIVKLAAALDVSPGKLVDMLVRHSGKSSASVTDIQKARERRKRR